MGVGAFIHSMSGVAKLVFLSAERHRRSGYTCCTVLGSRRRHPCLPLVAGASPLWTKLQQLAAQSSAIYTDGSKASFRDVAGFYEGRETSKASSGVALFMKMLMTSLVSTSQDRWG